MRPKGDDDMKSKRKDLEQALAQFVEAIEATGGVAREVSGLLAPVADPEWVDLGEAYARACAALGREPVVADHAGEVARSPGLESEQLAKLVGLHPPEDWRHEVANGDTRLGYEEWLVHVLERERD